MSALATTRVTGGTTKGGGRARPGLRSTEPEHPKPTTVAAARAYRWTRVVGPRFTMVILVLPGGASPARLVPPRTRAKDASRGLWANCVGESAGGVG